MNLLLNVDGSCWAETTRCVLHNKQCPTFVKNKDGLNVIFTGTVCTPWSSMGAGQLDSECRRRRRLNAYGHVKVQRV